MASKENDVIYGVRNLLRTHLNKTQTGFFLLDFLRKTNANAAKIANNKKTLKTFLALVEQNPAITITVLKNKSIGEERLWVSNTIRHLGHPFPDGWEAEVIEEIEEEQEEPLFKEESLDQPYTHVDAQQTKRDPRPEPSPIVYSTKEPATPNAFAALHEIRKYPSAAPVEQPAPEVVEEVAVPVVAPKIEQQQEKESVKMSSVADTSLTSENLMAKAEEMLAAAKQMAAFEKAQNLVNEVRAIQLEVAAATAKLNRILGEQMEAQEALDKASEKLRILVNGK